MSVFLIIAAYLVVAAALGSVAAATVRDRDDAAGVAALAMLWPFTGAPMVAVIIARHFRQERSFSEEVDRRVKRELNRRRNDLERTIAQLERENGIGGQR